MRNFSLESCSFGSPPDNLEYIGVADTNVVVYISESDHVALVRQFRPIFSAYTFELPGGSAGPTETSLNAAIREFHEETGILLGSARKLISVVLSMGTSNERVNIFSARHPDVLRVDEKNETDIEVVWHAIYDARVLLMQQDILDAKTLLGLMLAI